MSSDSTAFSMRNGMIITFSPTALSTSRSTCGDRFDDPEYTSTFARLSLMALTMLPPKLAPGGTSREATQQRIRRASSR